MSIIDSANFHAEVNTELLDRLLIHGDNEKVIRTIIKSVLQKARNNLSNDARSKLPKDPREAYRAVKHTVYRSILGGTLSILNKKKVGELRTPPSSRREKSRSKRTEKLLSYWGSDRGFILRFLNSGTGNRVSVNMNNHPIMRDVDDRPRRKGGYKSQQVGYRGNIEARNWFPGTAHKQMEKAAEELAKLVETEIAKQINK